MLYRMKVAAIVPDDLIASVNALAEGKNTTESLIKALREWVSIKQVARLVSQLDTHPLKFQKGNIGARLRKTNRKVS